MIKWYIVQKTVVHCSKNEWLQCNGYSVLVKDTYGTIFTYSVSSFSELEYLKDVVLAKKFVIPEQLDRYLYGIEYGN